MQRSDMIMTSTTIVVAIILIVTFINGNKALNEAERIQREYVVEHFGNDIGFDSYLEYQKFNNFTEYTIAKDIGSELLNEAYNNGLMGLGVVPVMIVGMVLSLIVPEKERND